jgi:hypothetical protein
MVVMLSSRRRDRSCRRERRKWLLPPEPVFPLEDGERRLLLPELVFPLEDGERRLLLPELVFPRTESGGRLPELVFPRTESEGRLPGRRPEFDIAT